jgi:PAB1-binding protein PBP1
MEPQTQQHSQSVNPEIVEAISASIQEMSTLLEQRLPGIDDQCRKINNLLRQEPRAAAMLTDEQIGEFMKAHYNIAHVEFATPKKSGAAGKAAIKKLAAEEVKDIII